MVIVSHSQACRVMHVRIQPDQKEAFAKWQCNFHTAIASYTGFISLEINVATQINDSEWNLKQCFENEKGLKAWCESASKKELLKTLRSLLKLNDPKAFSEEPVLDQVSGVTEVFVTKVNREERVAYREWIGKIHQAEIRFPGFQRVYVQSPCSEKSEIWITLLEFDTVEHLDQWLESKERKEILEKARYLVESIESHRFTSSFAGWFSQLTLSPPVWKQTMLVLLVLFPIVMLEFKLLLPWTSALNLSVGTFIGNAISVTLVSWPTMPIAIYFLKWWLNPNVTSLQGMMGTGIVLFLYLIEIIIFSLF